MNLEISSFRLRRQWAISLERPVQEIEWKVIPISTQYNLYYQQDLQIQRNIKGSHGVIILGIAINPEKPEDVIQDKLSSYLNDVTGFEDYLINIGGSYVIILFHDNDISLYTDPAGMMGVYYIEGMSASTPSLIPGSRRDQKIDNAIPFGPGNEWYTGDTVPYVGVKKLIPNCCLNLNTGTYVRHWPKNDSNIDSTLICDSDKTILTICSLLRGMVQSVIQRGKIIASITGGQDSRVVLAASIPFKNEIEYFTLKGKGVKKCDIEYAKQLATLSKINHRYIKIEPSEEWVTDLYDEISGGESIGARRDIAGTCLKIASSNTIHINGNLGAICKSHYWHSKKPNEFKETAILNDFIVKSPILNEGIKVWRDTVPDLHPVFLYNLYYMEQRGGRWMSVGENSSRLFYESLTPFNHRKILSYICHLPMETQYGGNLLKIFVQKLAPELLEVPYCKATRNWTKYVPEIIKKNVRRLRYG